jgi:hypothetical protein
VFPVNSIGELNTGYFACRTSDKMIDFWTRISNDPNVWKPWWTGFEETAAWERRHEMTYALLPVEEYWSPCIPMGDHPDPKWRLTALPPKIRVIHLACVLREEKRAVMRQAIELGKLLKPIP